MKKGLILIFLACVSFAVWRIHEKKLELAREEAMAEARREAAAEVAQQRASIEQERQAQLAREQAQEQAARERVEANRRRTIMAISKILDPLLLKIQAPLDAQQPADLVPVIELTKQRILDQRARAEKERQPVYDRATAAMDQLSRLAEDRTDFLEALLRNRANVTTTLNRPASGSASDFFSQTTAKRWEEAVARARPATLQAMEQLRAAEREWNKQLDRYAETERYDVNDFQPLMIPTEQLSQSSLNAKSTAGSKGTSTRIWRSSYYSMYGYRYPYYYPTN